MRYEYLPRVFYLVIITSVLCLNVACNGDDGTVSEPLGPVMVDEGDEEDNGDNGDSDDEEGPQDILVQMFNDSDKPIHILAPGENLAPENRLGPGQARQVLLAFVNRAEILEFRAGREGVICYDISCQVLRSGDDNFEVFWIEDTQEVVVDEEFTFESTIQELSCRGGLARVFHKALGLCPDVP